MNSSLINKNSNFLGRYKAALLSTALLLQPCLAHAEPPIPSITVSGTGEAMAKPDTAIFKIGVTSHSETAQQALISNNELMTKVIATLKKYNIEDADMQTSDFRIFETKMDNDKDTNTKISYNVHNGLAVKVRNLGKLGALYDDLVNSGANNSYNIEFTNQNKDKYISIATQEAVKNAIAKANIIAQAANAHIDHIIEIQDSTDPYNPIVSGYGMGLMSMARASTPIESGTLNYRANVTIKYSLKP